MWGFWIHSHLIRFTLTARLNPRKPACLNQVVRKLDDLRAIEHGLSPALSTAYNGLDGIKEFDKCDDCVDLVITDLVMPEISGIGVISVIKKKSPKLPVIAMTGWGESPGARARDAKADLVLNKPFELEDLDRHVAELLARKS